MNIHLKRKLSNTVDKEKELATVILLSQLYVSYTKRIGRNL